MSLSRRVAIIPARGGSRRIPRKNVREFHGMPMIAHSIKLAQESKMFDDIVVSTDDAAIAEVAIQYGATIPYMRPKSLADDHCGTVAVIKHAIQALELKDTDLICCIYATAVFSTAESVEGCLNLFLEGNGDYGFPVARFPAKIQRAFRQEGVFMVPLQSENVSTRTQDLPESFYDAGQFYWARAKTWIAELPIHSKTSVGYIVDGRKLCDIDEEEDWKHAEWLYKVLGKNL